MDKIQQLLNKYDLERMVEVLEDRVIDYYEYCAEYEEPHVNAGEDYSYPYGHGQTLKHTLELVKQLQELKDHMQSNTR